MAPTPLRDVLSSYDGVLRKAGYDDDDDHVNFDTAEDPFRGSVGGDHAWRDKKFLSKKKFCSASKHFTTVQCIPFWGPKSTWGTSQWDIFCFNQAVNDAACSSRRHKSQQKRATHLMLNDLNGLF